MKRIVLQYISANKLIILDYFYLSCNVTISIYLRARVAQWVRYLDYLTTHTSLSPIWRGFTPGFVNYKKGCTRLAAASDKAYQLLAHGRWFSLGTPASSTTKIGHHDIAEILLKVALNTKNQSINHLFTCVNFSFTLKSVFAIFLSTYIKVLKCTLN